MRCAGVCWGCDSHRRSGPDRPRWRDELMFESQVADGRSPSMSYGAGALIGALRLAPAAPAAWAQSKPAAMPVDDALVPLCTPGIVAGKNLASALGLYEGGAGSLIADFADAKGAQNCLKATAA